MALELANHSILFIWSSRHLLGQAPLCTFFQSSSGLLFLGQIACLNLLSCSSGVSSCPLIWNIFLCCLMLFTFLSIFLCMQLAEKAMAPHSSTLAWEIPWMEEPGRLQSMGLLGVRHNWATSLSLFTSCIGEGNGNPFQCSCLENPRDGGAWWAAVYGVAQSRTRLKRLSSSSSRIALLG